MITDLQETQFPETYTRFVDLLQSKPWLKATEKHKLQIKANPFSQDQIYRENRVAYGLTFFEADGMALAGSDVWPTVQHALSFAAQVCQLVDQAQDEAGKLGYLGRIRGAFSNPNEMRAIRFEHLTAMNMFRQGAQIEWPETKAGTERFDILATIPGDVSIELECKSCSPDKGRPITERDASQFFTHLVQRMVSATNPGEVLVMKVRIPKRLPTAESELMALAEEVKKAFEAGATAAEKDVLLTHQRYSSPLLANPVHPDYILFAVNELATRLFGAAEGHRAIVFAEKKPAALCIEICSGRAVEFFDAMWETAKHAIQKQMTKLRPGCLVIRLEGLARDELELLGQEVPNPLGWFAEKVLTDSRHQHLACLAYISDEEMTSTSPGTESAQSCSYVFDRPTGQYANLGIGRYLLGSKPAGAEPR
ncbi:hypothetical protein [Pseudomonas aeruginosa]|uniref:hypothetical protein n=1 Tax=Pseudomonas aeruginosa TaxID=287 RepID=UPI000FC41D6B|nr:hypothetical protein [Pseudomonas aeruginosa]RUF61055.1 hypothetical protein IPC1106_25915 [Pseudomonas aeruginosa]